MTARVIPTRVHGLLDYVVGSALIAAPTLLALDDDTVAARAPRFLGLGATAYSGATDYELGAWRMLPMPVHLAADGASGVALAAAPWVAKDAGRGVRYWLPHAVIGGGEVLLAATTQTRPADERLRNRVGRALARGPLKAPGSARTKAKVAGRAGRAGSKAAGRAGKAGAKGAASKPSPPARIAAIGMGLARELAARK